MSRALERLGRFAAGHPWTVIGTWVALCLIVVTTSAAFGRRAILTDSIIALVMTTLIYLAFDRLLTLSLPAGPLERLL